MSFESRGVISNIYAFMQTYIRKQSDGILLNSLYDANLSTCDSNEILLAVGYASVPNECDLSC